MKKYWPLLLLVLVLVSFTKPPKIVGIWDNIDLPGMGIKFDEDGTFYMVIGDMYMGGKDFNSGEEILDMTYELDETKSPKWLTLITANKTTNVTSRGECLFNIIDKDTIEFMFNDSDKPRPLAIDTASEQYIKFIRRTTN